jgi:hypothetical protein
MVFFRFAAAAAFLMFLRAAAFCLEVAMIVPSWLPCRLRILHVARPPTALKARFA